MSLWNLKNLAPPSLSLSPDVGVGGCGWVCVGVGGCGWVWVGVGGWVGGWVGVGGCGWVWVGGVGACID